MTARTRHNLRISLALFLIALAYIAPLYQVLKYSSQFDTPVVVSLMGSSVALITGILALLKDFILDAINTPSIKIEFLPNDNRDCHQTEFTSLMTFESGQSIECRTKTHYFRLRIINVGWKTAESVEVNLEEVKKYTNGTFQVDKDFMPLRLYWSHWRSERYELDIPSDTYRYCDFGFILEPETTAMGLPAAISGAHQFWLDVTIRPNTGKTSLSPGRYQITISASGKNVMKTTLVVELEWLGGWQNNIADLYANYLKIYPMAR